MLHSLVFTTIDTLLFTLLVLLTAAAGIVQESGHGWKPGVDTAARQANATAGHGTYCDRAAWSKSVGLALVAYSFYRAGDEVKAIVKGCHWWARGGGPDASSQCLGEGFQMLAELAAVYFVARGGECVAAHIAQHKLVQNLLRFLSARH